ncbi:putative DCN1 protein 2 [Paratrimastix pyriformis]|uniref:DCN1 protein 2 n=1 Tax=Paratrimastix pyriformis TaxID=342808 RepID=A0ABQ8UNE7_9EUKA|nr:putative DCN1 protein 2 [Paratrimastix pyriformis]
MNPLDRELFGAVKDNDVERLRKVLEEHTEININEYRYNDATPLQMAAQLGDLPMCQFLVARGADIDLCDAQGFPPVIHAADCADDEASMLVIQFFVGAGALTVDYIGEHCLISAVVRQKVQLTKYLLEELHVSADSRGAEEVPALMLAAGMGSLALCTLLLEHGATVDAQDEEGSTPLAAAADSSRPDVAQLLLSHGASPTHRNRKGSTPLHCVANRGDVACGRLLVEAVRRQLPAAAGSETPCSVHEYINAPSECDGATPLLLAVMRSHTEMAAFLLSEGADPTVFMPPRQGGFGLLHFCAQSGNAEMTRLLLGALPPAAQKAAPPGAAASPAASTSVTSTSVTSPSPAPSAAAAEAAPADRRLSIVNAVDRQGMTPLTYACTGSRLEVARLLLEAGADVHTVDPTTGMGLLHQAVTAEAPEMVRLLLAWGARHDLCDSEVGLNPIGWAEGAKERTAIVGVFHDFGLYPEVPLQDIPIVVEDACKRR